jgi:hypothetical protein
MTLKNVIQFVTWRDVLFAIKSSQNVRFVLQEKVLTSGLVFAKLTLLKTALVLDIFSNSASNAINANKITFSTQITLNAFKNVTL